MQKSVPRILGCTKLNVRRFRLGKRAQMIDILRRAPHRFHGKGHDGRVVKNGVDVVKVDESLLDEHALKWICFESHTMKNSQQPHRIRPVVGIGVDDASVGEHGASCHHLRRERLELSTVQRCHEPAGEGLLLYGPIPVQLTPARRQICLHLFNFASRVGPQVGPVHRHVTVGESKYGFRAYERGPGVSTTRHAYLIMALHGMYKMR